MNKPQIGIGTSPDFIKNRDNYDPGGYEHAKHRILQKSITNDLSDLKGSITLSKKQFLQISVEIKKNDSLSAIAYGIDNFATAQYKAINNGQIDHAKKPININGNTMVYYANGQSATLGSPNSPIIYPGQLVSLREVNGQTIIDVKNKGQDTTPIKVVPVEQAPVKKLPVPPLPNVDKILPQVPRGDSSYPINTGLPFMDPNLEPQIERPSEPKLPSTNNEPLVFDNVDFMDKIAFSEYAANNLDNLKEANHIKNRIHQSILASIDHYITEIPPENLDKFFAVVSVFIVNQKSRTSFGSSISSIMSKMTGLFKGKRKTKKSVKTKTQRSKPMRVKNKVNFPWKTALGVAGIAALSSSAGMATAMSKFLPSDIAINFDREVSSAMNDWTKFQKTAPGISLQPYYKAVSAYAAKKKIPAHEEFHFQINEHEMVNFKKAETITRVIDKDHPLIKIFGENYIGKKYTFTNIDEPIDGLGNDIKRGGLGVTLYDGLIILSQSNISKYERNSFAVETNEAVHYFNDKTILGQSHLTSFENTMWVNKYLKAINPTPKNIEFNELQSDTGSLQAKGSGDIERIIQNTFSERSVKNYQLTENIMEDILGDLGYKNKLSYLHKKNSNYEVSVFIAEIKENGHIQKIKDQYAQIGSEIHIENMRLSKEAEIV